MPTLSKDAEIDLLKIALAQFSDPSGWQSLLGRIDEHLNCRAFIAEFDADGHSSARFVDPGHASEITNLLAAASTGFGTPALSALIQNGDPSLCYELASGLISDLGPTTGDTLQPGLSEPQTGATDHPAGLIGVIRRPPGLPVLIGLLFPGALGSRALSPATITSFWKIRRIVELGLAALDELESAQDRATAHKILGAHNATPSVMINGASEVLAEISPALAELERLGAATRQDGTLRFTNRHLEKGLKRALASRPGAVSTSRDATCQTVFLRAADEDLRRITLRPVTPPGGRATSWIMIQVLQPTEIPISVETLLQAEYGLSPTESLLARLLTTTGSVQETTEFLNITRNTLKTHLRRIFDKTGTHTQLELIRLVHRLTGLV